MSFKKNAQNYEFHLSVMITPQIFNTHDGGHSANICCHELGKKLAFL